MMNTIAMLSLLVAGTTAGTTQAAQETTVRRAAARPVAAQAAERGEIVSEYPGQTRARSPRQMHAARLTVVVSDAPSVAPARSFDAGRLVPHDGVWLSVP
jgi:hypothetical protein